VTDSDYSAQHTSARRVVFGATAQTYHDYRPDYPEELFDDLQRVAGLEAGSRVLEVGAGTGLFTSHLVRRGYEVTAIEPEEGMAAVARAHVPGAFTQFAGRLEDFEGVPESADLVVAATSWMWVDPEHGFERAAALLRHGGHFAHAWQTLVDLAPEGIEQAFAEVFAARAPELARSFNSQRHVADGWDEKILESGYFVDLERFEYRYERSFDPWSFVASASTYGMWASLEASRREELDGRLATVIAEEFGGSATRLERSLLFIARRP
jgi:SAM-dependent methyltransferase